MQIMHLCFLTELRIHEIGFGHFYSLFSNL